MPAHFTLSSLIPLTLTREWHPLAACLPSFLSSLPPYLPPRLSLFPPSIFLFIPPSLYSLFSMFLISSVQIPEIFRNLSYIVYDTHAVFDMPSNISRFNMSVSAWNQDTTKTATCIHPKTSWFWAVEICLEFLQVLSWVMFQMIFLSIKWKKI